MNSLLLVQREDSLSLAHRRMSAHGSPRSRHSTGEISKGDHRRSRFHFAPADLLNADTFHQVTGGLQHVRSLGRQAGNGLLHMGMPGACPLHKSHAAPPQRLCFAGISAHRACSSRMPARACFYIDQDHMIFMQAASKRSTTAAYRSALLTARAAALLRSAGAAALATTLCTCCARP